MSYAEKRSFRKLHLEELVAECLGPPHTRIGYFFPAEVEAIQTLAEVSSPDFRYQTDANGDVLLFSVDGIADPRPFCEILQSATCTDQRKDGWLLHQFEFPSSEELFAKSMATGSMYRVVAIETSRKFTKKV